MPNINLINKKANSKVGPKAFFNRGEKENFSKLQEHVKLPQPHYADPVQTQT